MSHVTWFQRNLRPCTSRLIMKLTKNKLKGSDLLDDSIIQETGSFKKSIVRQGTRGSMIDNPEMQDQEKTTFFEKLLPALNQKLLQGNNSYFGEVISIADLIYYCEISTVLTLGQRELSKT